MKIIIELNEELYNYMQTKEYDEHLDRRFDYQIRFAIQNGTPLPDIFDLQGLKSDMKALNCGFPYGLDYLLNCLEKRLGITINETENSIL